jgi:hypothetical protein
LFTLSTIVQLGICSPATPFALLIGQARFVIFPLSGTAAGDPIAGWLLIVRIGLVRSRRRHLARRRRFRGIIRYLMRFIHFSSPKQESEKSPFLFDAIAIPARR